MNSAKIDEVLEALKKENIDRLIEISEIDVKEIDFEHLRSKENAQKVLGKIMQKIEQGDYEYFSSKIYKPEIRREYLTLLCYSSKKGDIKKAIEDRKKFNIKKEDIAQLLVATEDTEYIESFLSDDENIKEFRGDTWNLIKIIAGTKDFEYIREILENRELREGKFELFGNNIADLIIQTNNIEYIKELIEDKEKIEEFFIDTDHVVELIKSTKDIEYIKEIVENRENINRLRLDTDNVVELIIAIGSKEYIEDILDSPDRINEFELDDLGLSRLILEAKDNEEIEEFFKQKEAEYRYGNIDSKIILPKNMTIGTEIESEGLVSREIKEKLSDVISKGWKTKDEASIPKGVEVISPILSGDMNESTEEIKKVCRRLDILRSSCYI